MILGKMYEALGDYSSAEQQAREEIRLKTESGERQNREAKKAGLSMRLPPLEKLVRPRLAKALLYQGKIKEAQEIVDAIRSDGGTAQSQRTSEVGDIAMSHYGDGLSGQDDVLFAEVCLANSDPERALEYVNSARKYFRKSSEVHRTNFPQMPDNVEKANLPGLLDLQSRCLWQLKRVEEAVDTQEQVIALLGDLPPHHPQMLAARISRAWGWLDLGKEAEAKRDTEAIANDQLRSIADLMRYGSVRQRMVYLQQADPFSLSIASDQIPTLTSAVVRLKGVVLNSVLEEQRLLKASDDPEAQRLALELNQLRKRLVEGGIGGNEDADAIRRQVETAESRLAKLTSTEFSSRTALTVTPEQIQAQLEGDEALVEYVTYREMAQPGIWAPHYGALIFRPGQPATWRRLGEADAIDTLIDGFLARMRGQSLANQDEILETALRNLYDRLLAPLQSDLGGTQRLIVSPDGNLGRISMAALLAPDGKFASEHWEMAYVSSCRDLLKDAAAKNRDGNGLVLLADPDYDGAAGGAVDTKNRRGVPMAFDRQRLPLLERLAGTRQEMDRVVSLFNDKAIPVSAFSGGEAREEVLRQMPVSPRYLHLATHGFVLPPTSSIQAANSAKRIGFTQSNAVSDDPLQRAALALAGANKTLATWQNGEVPPPSTDGILSAAEVATLDLSNTWLAVLSACDTAEGEALNGEGVMGMRRGFFLAGVDHLVMTFWPIADQETVEIMADFYQEIGKDVHPATAMHRVQREALVRWRQEKGLAQAVFLAGPFALSTKGKLPPM